MKYLLDTNILISVIRKKQSVARMIGSFQKKELNISVITLAELRIGAYKSNNPKKSLMEVEDLIDNFSLTDFDRLCADRFAWIKYSLARKGRLIEDTDIIIASTALANRMTLVTSNTRHFERIKDLKLENWLKD